MDDLEQEADAPRQEAENMMQKAKLRVAASRESASSMMQQAKFRISTSKDAASILEITSASHQVLLQIVEALQQMVVLQQQTLAAFERPKSVSFGAVKKDGAGVVISADISTRLN